KRGSGNVFPNCKYVYILGVSKVRGPTESRISTWITQDYDFKSWIIPGLYCKILDYAGIPPKMEPGFTKD
ncbi:MAG: hypothetical protein VX772_07370, partial [Bacteroidota bacterium]|nr:hypothetical protein [Bacteroidota bacterium]